MPVAAAVAKLVLLVFLFGCPGPARRAAPTSPPPAEYVEVDVEIEESDGPPGLHEGAPADPPRTAVPSAPAVASAPPPAPPSAALKDQPPHLKLKLGHFRNARHNIGVTIDLTEQTENVADVDPAKLRFDGDARIWRLSGQHGAYGRLDYVREGGGVTLHVHANGGMSIYLRDPNTGQSSDEIYLHRDGDADPL